MGSARTNPRAIPFVLFSVPMPPKPPVLVRAPRLPVSKRLGCCARPGQRQLRQSSDTASRLAVSPVQNTKASMEVRSWHSGCAHLYRPCSFTQPCLAHFSNGSASCASLWAPDSREDLARGLGPSPMAGRVSLAGTEVAESPRQWDSHFRTQSALSINRCGGEGRASPSSELGQCRPCPRPPPPGSLAPWAQRWGRGLRRM